MTGIVALVLIVIFFMIIAGIGKSGRMMTSDARGLFSRKCPNCRLRIHDRAQVCRHCMQPTGFPTSRHTQSVIEAPCVTCKQVINRFRPCPHCSSGFECEPMKQIEHVAKPRDPRWDDLRA
jgi:hypothetical protein